MTNNKGFSLIELIVGAAILGIAVMGFSKFFLEAKEKSTGVAQDLELIAQSTMWSKIILNQDTCTSALQDQVVDVSSADNVIQFNFPDATNPILVEGLEVSPGVTLVSSKASFDELSVTPSTIHYLMRLNLKFERNNQETGLPIKDRNLVFPVALKTSADGSETMIESCVYEVNDGEFAFDPITCPAGEFLTGIDGDLQPLCSTAQTCGETPGAVSVSKPYVFASPKCIEPFKGCAGTVDLIALFPEISGAKVESVTVENAPGNASLFAGDTCTGKRVASVEFNDTKTHFKNTWFTLKSTISYNPGAKTVSFAYSGFCKNPFYCAPCLDSANISVCYVPAGGGGSTGGGSTGGTTGP